MAARRQRIYSSPPLRCAPCLLPAFPASACSIRPARRTFPTKSCTRCRASRPTSPTRASRDLIAACESGLKAVLGTDRAEVFFYAANGHGGWEAVIANLVAPGTAVLVPGTGHFSDGWAEQVEAFGGIALRTPYREGHPIDPAAVEAALRDDRAHAHRRRLRRPHRHRERNDVATSRRSGARSTPRGHPALFVVDVVASLAAAPFAMDALGADVAIGASQKGLMVHPGSRSSPPTRARSTPQRAIRRRASTGTGSAAAASSRTASSAARRRSRTSPGSRPRSA